MNIVREKVNLYVLVLLSRSTEARHVIHSRIPNEELFSFCARTQDMDKFSSFAEDVTLARF